MSNRHHYSKNYNEPLRKTKKHLGVYHALGVEHSMAYPVSKLCDVSVEPVLFVRCFTDFN